MRKIIYQTIRAALLAIEDGEGQKLIGHVDLYNNQLAYTDGEQPFNTPAVLIEFGEIEWRHLPHKVREAVVQVRLHVVTDSRVGRWSDAVEVFDLLDKINAALHGLTYSDGDGNVMDALTSLSSATDSDFDELQDNVETYSAHVTDASARQTLTHRASTVELRVDAVGVNVSV